MKQKKQPEAAYYKDLQMLRYTNEMFSWIDELFSENQVINNGRN